MKSKYRGILALAMVVSVSGCAKKQQTLKINENELMNKEFSDCFANIDSEDIMQAVSQVDMLYNVSDSKVMYELSSDIALITVLSIDGATNYCEQTGEYCCVGTYGKLQVHKVFKGNLKENQEIKYLRAGGIISYDDYFAGLTDSQKEKQMIQKGERPKYVEYKILNDIEIEAGKTYLAYMLNPDEGVFARRDTYAITGVQGGLREVKSDSKLKSPTTDQIQVYNNFTQKWETLDEIYGV